MKLIMNEQVDTGAKIAAIEQACLNYRTHLEHRLAYLSKPLLKQSSLEVEIKKSPKEITKKLATVCSSVNIFTALEATPPQSIKHPKNMYPSLYKTIDKLHVLNEIERRVSQTKTSKGEARSEIERLESLSEYLNQQVLTSSLVSNIKVDRGATNAHLLAKHSNAGLAFLKSIVPILVGVVAGAGTLAAALYHCVPQSRTFFGQSHGKNFADELEHTLSSPKKNS
jgi:ribosome-associated translation inhibitor RaiA